MKTKISHLGRSSVSVILAVMMLLSTMLVGTVSTVNAVTKKFDSVNLVGDINGNVKWDSTDYPFTFDENTGYWNLDITFTKKSIFKARVNNSWDKSFGDSNGNDYVISDNEIGDYTISIKDNSDDKAPLKVEKKTVKKVADSVTLTASSNSVQVGKEVTLTASLSNKAAGLSDADVTYAFERTNGATVTGTTTGNTYKFTPTTAGDYTFKVTAFATNYSSVTNTVTVTATSDSSAETTQPVTSDYYFWYSTTQNINLYSDNWKAVPMTKNGSNYSVSNLPVNTGGNFYFIVNKDAKIPYRNTVWKTKEDVTVDCSTCAGKFSSYNKTNYHVPMESDPHQLEPVFYYYISVTTDGSYSFTFDGDKTVKVTEGSIQPTEPTDSVKIEVPTVENAIVTAVADSKTYNEGESFDIKVGSSFTVNVKGENNYTLNNITYGTQSETVTGASFTAKSGVKTFTVAMNPPVSNQVTVTFGSNKGEYGTVSAMNGTTSLNSPAKVNVGDTVKFTAEPKSGYALSDWTVTVNGTSETYTGSSLSLKITADTTVTAKFKVEDSGTPSDYYILWGTDASFSQCKAKQLYSKDGKYYANFDAATDEIGTSKDYFFVFSKSNTINGVTAEENSVTINEVDQDKFYFKSNNSVINNVGTTKVPKIWNGNDDLIGFKIIVSDINGKVTYSCEPTFDVAPADTVEITAKDGTIRGTTATIADLGNTTIEVTTPEGKTLKATDSFSNKAQTVKKVPDKSTVKVTTTIDESKTFAGVSGSGYYVKGFSINGIFGGVLSQSEGKSHDSDVYTFEFTVNQELYNETKLEITPVYFLKDDSNCVYFYIENYDSAKQIWGNTPSCYVYYGSGKTTLEALGYYPGQPMVDYNGSIFTQIPKSIDNGGTTPVKITGMTLNNYVWDDVHSAYNGKNQREDNAQTYDYDDFVKIAESGAADNIIYRFKYNTFDNEPADTFDASKYDATGWEVFLDYQNYPTDIFGNRIGTAKLDYKDTQSVTSQGNYLSIISDGYQNNYIGQYATAWSIYDKAGNKVATIPSSALLYALDKNDAQMTEAIKLGTTPGDFLPGKESRDTYWETFKTLYENYKGFYAQINFEAAIKQGPDVGNRLDGRWYYTKSSQDITGEIKIQYANTLDDYNKVGGFQEDTFADEKATSIIGNTTGASAYFTDPVKRVRKLTTTADNTQDYKFEVTATPSTAAYTFVGWYRLIDGDYKAINPSDMSSLTGAVTRNSDVTLVARYIKTPGGSMTFQHSLYNGTNAGGGKATTEIQVVVKNSEGKSLYDSGKIAGTASIDKNMIANFAKQEGLTVTVTLFTTTKNLYDFKGYYSAENTTNITAFDHTTADFTTTVSGDRTNGRVTESVYTFSFNKYYKTHQNTLIGPDAGTVYYNFYSDITSIKVPYKVQFSYTDRTGAQKYYNRAGYVDPENTTSYTIDEDTTVESRPVKVTLTDSFILTLAPYESNFAKDLTWNKTPDSNTPFDSSNSKSIASAVVKSTQSDKKIHLSVYRDGNGNPTPRTNTKGHFELFTRNNSPELPYGSVFYTSNGDGTYTYDIKADKTYIDENGKEFQFMYWAIYSDEDCNNLVINAYNSEGNFSYVAYDNCWIVPVYGESSTPVASVKDVYTSTQFMEVTRNQWTAGDTISFNGFDADSMKTLDTAEDFIKGDGEDKLYADFVLNFFYNGKQLSVFDPTSSKVQTGVVMQKLKLENDSIGVGYNTDMKYYATKYINDLPAAAEDAKNKILTGKSSIESLKKQIDNNRLDNKNRLQYYARFNNTEANVNCVYRVYTYIKYVNELNEPVVQLGKPIYFTLYDVANATV